MWIGITEDMFNLKNPTAVIVRGSAALGKRIKLVDNYIIRREFVQSESRKVAVNELGASDKLELSTNMNISKYGRILLSLND